MTTMRELHNIAGLKEGAARARREQRPVLVSQTRWVDNLEPLSFFASATRFRGTRNFWSDPDRGLTLVGVGVAWKLETYAREGSYLKTEQEWDHLLKGAIRVPAETPTGTGPLLLGGFSFDPLAEKTPLWEGFFDASFILPQFLLTVTGGKCWLTVNVLLRPGEDVEQRGKILTEEERALLETAADFQFSPPAQTSFDVLEVEPDRWKKTVATAAREIREGALEKVVLARPLQLESETSFSPEAGLYRLLARQAHGFLFAVERGDACLLSASPERLVKSEGERFYSTCLAGTIRRGKDPEEDRKLGEELLADPKNGGEHAVVVHMIREAFQEGCFQVRVPDSPTLYQAQDVQHLFTPVEGTPLPETTLLSMVARLHPTPALGGYPQKEAVARIREIEGMDRGWYSAPVGWLDDRGNGEFACAIRSGLLRGREASLFAGCGIVGDSEPDSEYEETNLKFKPMLSALGGDSR
ncbi:menaquinone-specific isochorismate synthase [Kroppenstedtia sanguinis]